MRTTYNISLINPDLILTHNTYIYEQFEVEDEKHFFKNDSEKYFDPKFSYSQDLLDSIGSHVGPCLTMLRNIVTHYGHIAKKGKK